MIADPVDQSYTMTLNQVVQMKLQAYIDESVSTDGTMVLGGFISTEEKWQEFSKEWENMLKPFGILKEGSSSYHFKYQELAAFPHRRERIDAFKKVAFRHALMGISVRINIRELEAARGRVVTPRHILDFGPYTDPYKFAFRCLMDKFHLHRDTAAAFIDPTTPVDFIFDEQSGSKKEILESWEAYIRDRSPDVRHLYGAKPRFLSDDTHLPLQAADLFAGMIREKYERSTLDDDTVPIDGRQVMLPCIRMEWDEDAITTDLVNTINIQANIGAFDSKILGIPWTTV